MQVTLQTVDGSRVRLESEYAECRDRTLGGGHVWTTARKIGRRTSFGTPVSKQCARCGAWVHIIIGAYGQVESRQYEYPDGYSLAADEQPTGDSLRLAMLSMLKEEQKQMSFDDDGYIKAKPRTRKPAANRNGRSAKKKTTKVVDVAAEERNEQARHLRLASSR